MSENQMTKLMKSKVGIISLVVVIVALLLFLGYWLIKQLPDQPQTKKRVQQITVITPPPPPPPPPPEEKIEEPEIEEEAPPEEPLDESPPEDSPPDDAPPPGEDLGVDADGSGAGDAFGLVGKKGGRGLLDGGGGGYGVLVQAEINKAIIADKELKSLAYDAIVTLWVNEDGSLDRYKIRMLSGGSAEKVLDRFLSEFDGFSKRLPLEEGNDWFKIKIRSKI